jgi:hypothetical protein
LFFFSRNLQYIFNLSTNFKFCLKLPLPIPKFILSLNQPSLPSH